MKKLMTRHFSRWAAKQKIPKHELDDNALTEIVAGNFEANLGGYLYHRFSHSKTCLKQQAFFTWALNT
jgi:hypothetical protein